MTTKRTLRQQLHISGKAAGHVLVDWLNCEGSYQGRKQLTSAHRRIEGFLDEWRSLASFPVPRWDANDWHRFDELQKKLSHYRMHPQIDSKRMGTSGMRFTWNPGPSEEAKVILVITWLGERALLWKVRRCGHASALLDKLDDKKPVCCGKWFYARRKDQKFCGSRICRQRVYASNKKTPKDRAKRAEYMRTYRATQRQRDETFFAQFRKPKSKGQGKVR